MSKKLILVLGLVFFFLGANLARAEVVINEVQLSPTEGRFIELYNGSSSAVDLTDWYIQRKTANGSDFGSLISKTYFENKTIKAGGYFLISKNIMENADIVLDSLTLTESNTIQLKNANREVVDKIGWGSGESSVGDNPPDGQSIQKTENGWISSTPTSGTVNETVVTPPSTSPTDNTSGTNSSNTSSSSSSSSSSANTTEIKTKAVENHTMKVKTLTKTLAFTEKPFEIQNNNVSSDIAISGGVEKINSNHSYLPIFGSVIFIGASASAVYFIRRKRVTGEEANDFEILDE